MQQSDAFVTAKPQRIVCTGCGSNFVQQSRILPENHRGCCTKCGKPTKSLGIAALPRKS